MTRNALLTTGLGWLLVVLACYGQIWLRVHLGSLPALLIDVAVLVVAISVTVATGVTVWQGRGRRPVALLAVATVLFGAVIVLLPWSHAYLLTRFLLHRSDFDRLAARSCTPRAEIDPYGQTVHRCRIGPATFAVAAARSVLYLPAEPEASGGQPMFSACTQEYWLHVSGPIPAATWASDPDLMDVRRFPELGWSLADGWSWMDACDGIDAP